MIAFTRGIVHRLGEWVEAITHTHIHFLSHQVPLAFHADPEKRELALLGYRQRRYPVMSDFEKSWWEWHHGEAAERGSETVGSGACSGCQGRPFEFPAGHGCDGRHRPHRESEEDG